MKSSFNTMSHPALPSGQIVRIAKVSGVAFLEAVDRAWQGNWIALIGSDELGVLYPQRAEHPAPGGGWREGAFVGDTSPEIAQISSTSGTTGTPKAIVIPRLAISDTVHRIVDSMEMDSSIREYIGVPVTYSFGLGRARAIAAAGGAAFLPEAGFRPDEIAQMLICGQINALSAVPTMLRTIIADPDIIGGAGKKLKWLEIGSQYMSGVEKGEIRRLFPSAIILQHYGLTEASRSTFLRIDLAKEEVLESVGKPCGTGRIRINHEGLIEVAGDHLASGILRSGRLDGLVDDEGWLTTRDLGEIEDGWLYYKGRADDVANIGGVKVSAEHFERRLASAVASREIGVTVVRDKLRGEKLAVALPVGTSDASIPDVYAIAAESGLRPADLLVAELEELPRTSTGKLRRGELSRLLEGIADERQPTGSDMAPEAASLTMGQREIISIWSEALGITGINKDHSFYDLGGDSLSAVSVLIRAEQAGLPKEVMQRMFAGETVEQIAQAVEGNSPVLSPNLRAIRADGLNAARGILALLIVVSHWSPWLVDRSGKIGAILWDGLGPVLRIGTPGFAMIFGVGLSLFYFSQLDGGEKQLWRRIRVNTIIVTGGVALIGAAQAWRIYATGERLGPNWPERLFYEVLLFYALMLPTSPIWLKLIRRGRDRILASLLLAAGSYSFWLLLRWALADNQFSGWSSLAWHLAVAPYGYPRMFGAVALGIAAGLWLEKQSSSEALVHCAAKLGTGLIVSGVLLVASLNGGWRDHAGEIIAIPAFAGGVLLLLALTVRIASLGGVWSRRLRLAIIAGLLAFPIFIGHGLVEPIMTVLRANAVPYVVALLVPMATFAGVISLLGWRIHRMIYSRIP